MVSGDWIEGSDHPTLVSQQIQQAVMITLIDAQKTFVLRAPHTPRYQQISSDIGGRKTKIGWQYPRMMSVYDALHARIPGLNELKFENARGFPLKDIGQDRHPKWSTLRAYQQDTVDVLVSSPHPGVLVELSPGLGKSPVTVVAADAAKMQNVLFVAVKSLRRNWEREIRVWSGREARTLFHESPDDAGWYITNYDTLVSFYKRAHPQPRKDKEGKIIPPPPAIPDPFIRKWDLIVFDESVLLKNRKALRTKVVQILRPHARRVWCLTGSPTTRYADDLWSQLRIVHPTAFSSYWRFAERYCYIDETVWGKRIVGTRHDVDFSWELRDCIVTYNQKDVLDLPAVIHESVDLDMTPEQTAVYDDLLAAFVAELESGQTLSTPNKVARLTRLNQVVSNLVNVDGGDHSSKADAVEDLIDGGEIEYPLLIWCHYVPGAHALYERLIAKKINVTIATGEEKDVESIIEGYKQGDVDCLILSMTIGKYGHTLLNTRTVIYVDRTFDADAYYQSLKRIERFGLDHSPVVYTLRCPGTTEEMVEDNLAGKMETIASVTDADMAKLLRTLGKE